MSVGPKILTTRQSARRAIVLQKVRQQQL